MISRIAYAVGRIGFFKLALLAAAAFLLWRPELLPKDAARWVVQIRAYAGSLIAQLRPSSPGAIGNGGLGAGIDGTRGCVIEGWANGRRFRVSVSACELRWDKVGPGTGGLY